jgi:hypothetical protein
MEWHPFYYKGEETNIEVNKLGEVRRVYKDWVIRNHKRQNIKRVCSRGYIKVAFVCKKRLPFREMHLHKIMGVVFLNHNICGLEFVIDHIDMNKLNNCIDNLRVVTQRENSANRRDASKYGTGVVKTKSNKYIATITYNKKLTYLKTYNTPDEAFQSYTQAKKQIEAGKFDPKTFLKKSEK